MDEPIWLSRQVVEIIHLAQIAEHGGRPGLRDENVLESALAGPRQLVTSETGVTLPRLAAALCIGIARNHAFVDGNKRVALLAMYAFLRVNGLELDAAEMEAAETIESVAAGSLEELALTDWIADHIGG